MARNVLGAKAGIVHDRSHTLDRALAPLLASERSRRFLWIALGGYLVLLHLVGLAALTKPNLVIGTLKRLGYAPFSSEFGSAYRQTDDMLRRLDNAARPGGVVFLGDSHLRSLDQGAVAPRPINFAVPGDTTARVLERMKSYRSLASARAVVLQVGSNDLIFRDVAETEKNYAEILKLIPASIPVLATAVLPVLEELADSDGKNAEIALLNRGIEWACKARRNCTFVDATARLVDAGGDLRSEYHVGDGIHLSASGYRIWTDMLEAALANQLGRRVVHLGSADQ